MTANRAIIQMSEDSTSYYTDIIKNQYPQASFHTISTDFGKINQHLPNSFAALAPLLTTIINQVKAKKIEHILVPNITIHEAIDHLKLLEGSTISICHPLALAQAYITENKIENIALLGTQYTMQNPYWLEALAATNARVYPLSEEQIAAIDSLRKSIYQRAQEDHTAIWQGILAAIPLEITPILACTELSMINTHNRCIDVATLQVKAFIHD